MKGDIDLLTTTDKKCEDTIKKLIKKHFPSHTILAEESSADGRIDTAPANYKWIIDPIDGTTNFYHSFPQCCTSIGIEKDGEIIMGGIIDPMRDELFFAEKGKGARLNGKRIRVSSHKKLSDSLLITGFPYDRRKRIDFYLRFLKVFIMQCHGVRRMGAAALDFCYIACGRADGYWEYNLKPWDVAAGSLIVEEAGGKVTDFKNKAFNVYQSELLASNGIIHSEMIKVIQKHLK